MTNSNWAEDHTKVIPTPLTDAYAEARYAAANPYGTQVGGNHYSKYAIQPTEYILKNKMNFVEGNIIKYVTRYRDKNGLEDLYKARHYLDILINEVESETNGK